MQRVFNCQEKSYEEIESSISSWLKENPLRLTTKIFVGKNPKVRELILKEAKELGLRVIEWHYDPKIIFVL
jgi:hypothetical protein